MLWRVSVGVGMRENQGGKASENNKKAGSLAIEEKMLSHFPNLLTIIHDQLLQYRAQRITLSG